MTAKNSDDGKTQEEKNAEDLFRKSLQIALDAFRASTTTIERDNQALEVDRDAWKSRADALEAEREKLVNAIGADVLPDGQRPIAETLISLAESLKFDTKETTALINRMQDREAALEARAEAAERERDAAIERANGADKGRNVWRNSHYELAGDLVAALKQRDEARAKVATLQANVVGAELARDEAINTAARLLAGPALPPSAIDARALAVEIVNLFSKGVSFGLWDERVRLVEQIIRKATGAAKNDPWVDTRIVSFDGSVRWGHGSEDNLEAWDNYRMEMHTPHGSFAVWKSGAKSWSLYGGPSGILALNQYSNEAAAKCDAEQIALSLANPQPPPAPDTERKLARAVESLERIANSDIQPPHPYQMRDAARAALSDIGTAPAEAEGDGWLPIETAPKDGTVILLRGGVYHGMPFAGTFNPSKYKPDEPWENLISSSRLPDHCIYEWMPIAAPRQAQRPKPESADGWIEWNGGKCPVPGEMVDIKLRNGEIVFKCRADLQDWKHWNHSDDIIAYRVCPKPAQGEQQ